MSDDRRPPQTTRKTPIGDLIRNIRMELGKATQEDCAKALGISRSMLALIESGGRAPQDGLLQLIAYKYGKTPQERSYLLREMRLATLAYKEEALAQAIPTEEPNPQASLGELLPFDLQVLIKSRAMELGIPEIRLAMEIGLSMETFNLVLSGLQPISREGIARLAEMLGEDANAWLIYTGYIPPEMRDVVAKLYSGGKGLRKRMPRKTDRKKKET